MKDLPMRRARELAAERNFGEAEAVLRELLGSSPEDVDALNLLGFVLFFQARYPEAEEVCRRTIEVAPSDAYAIKGLASCLAKQGRMGSARPHFERAAELRPAWFDAYWDWAVALIDAGEIDEAQAIVARGERAVPNRTPQWKSLLDHLRTRGDKGT